jgi:diacylglycerol kinase (ATP)
VVLVAVILKALTRSARPFYGGPPSAHAAVAFAGWVAASFLAAGSRHAGFVSLLSLLMALLVCQSRLESGLHDLYAVVTGAALGSLATVAIFQLV